MGESKQDDPSRHQSHAAIWSAIIGSAGVIIAALIGVSVVRGRGEEESEGLRRELAKRDAVIAELSKETPNNQESQKKSADTPASEVPTFGQQRPSAVPSPTLTPTEPVQTPEPQSPQNSPSRLATGENSGSSPGAAPSTTHTAISGPHVVVRDPFRFTLNECIHMEREQRVRCRLLVENISNSKQPLVLNPMYASGGRISFLVTEDGTQYHATSNRSAVAAALARSPKLVPGIATAVDLMFSGITRKLGSAILVVEADKGLLGKEFTVKFPPIAVGEK